MNTAPRPLIQGDTVILGPDGFPQHISWKEGQFNFLWVQTDGEMYVAAELMTEEDAKARVSLSLNPRWRWVKVVPPEAAPGPKVKRYVIVGTVAFDVYDNRAEAVCAKDAIDPPSPCGFYLYAAMPTDSASETILQDGDHEKRKAWFMANVARPDWEVEFV